MYIPKDMQLLPYIKKMLNSNISCENEIAIDCKIDSETKSPLLSKINMCNNKFLEINYHQKTYCAFDSQRDK